MSVKTIVFQIGILLSFLCYFHPASFSQSYSIEIDNTDSNSPWGSAFGGISIDDDGYVYLNVENINPFLFPLIISSVASTSLARISPDGVVEYHVIPSTQSGPYKVSKGHPILLDDKVIELQNYFAGFSCGIPNVRFPGVKIYNKDSGELIEEFELAETSNNYTGNCKNDVFISKTIAVKNNFLYALVEIDYEFGLHEEYGQTLDFCEFDGNTKRMWELRKYDLNDFTYDILNSYQVEKHRSFPATLRSDYNTSPFLWSIQYNANNNSIDSYFSWLNVIKSLNLSGELTHSFQFDFQGPIEIDEDGLVINGDDLWVPYYSTERLSNGHQFVLYSSTIFDETRLFALDGNGELINEVVMEDYYNQYAFIQDEVWLFEAGRIISSSGIKRLDKDLEDLPLVPVELDSVILEGISEYENHYFLYGTQYCVDLSSLELDINNPPDEPYAKAFLRKNAIPVETNISNDCSNVSVFPNPIRDELFFESYLPIKRVRIFHKNGKLLLVQNSNEKMHLKNLRTGLYFVEVLLENNESVVKTVMKL